MVETWLYVNERIPRHGLPNELSRLLEWPNPTTSLLKSPSNVGASPPSLSSRFKQTNSSTSNYTVNLIVYDMRSRVSPYLLEFYILGTSIDPLFFRVLRILTRQRGDSQTLSSNLHSIFSPGCASLNRLVGEWGSFSIAFRLLSFTLAVSWPSPPFDFKITLTMKLYLERASPSLRKMGLEGTQISTRLTSYFTNNTAGSKLSEHKPLLYNHICGKLESNKRVGEKTCESTENGWGYIER